ncbi:MAG TPA: hypothetical protein VFG11_00580, partial [Acidobacteriota bacterium]|nr:hypothetical protein [Acidobacteriota bacterium]
LSEDLPHALVGETLKNWSFRAFESISTQSIPMPLRVDIVAEENRIRGVVRNETNLNLTKSFFFFNRLNVAPIGDIPAHGSREFSFTLTGKSSMPYTEVYLRDLLNLYSPSYSSPHFFYAETPETRGAISVNGKIRDTFLYQYLAVYVQIHALAAGSPWDTRPDDAQQSVEF